MLYIFVTTPLFVIKIQPYRAYNIPVLHKNNNRRTTNCFKNNEFTCSVCVKMPVLFSGSVHIRWQWFYVLI